MRFAPGIYCLNKPKGWTSFDVVKWVRCRTNEKKVGHAGTLDPNATGLLLVAVGKQFTKNIEQLIGADKQYIAEMILGIETDSYDIDGKVVRQIEKVEINSEQLEKVFAKYQGQIQQTPPMFSAKKINGQKLYDLARQGTEIEREPITVEIKNIKILQINYQNRPRITFQTDVSKGTYIRSLVQDIGQELGCGATLAELQRTRIGDYVLHPQFSIDPLQEKVAQCI